MIFLVNNLHFQGISEIKNGSSFGIDQILDPQPKCYEKIKGKAKAQRDKGEIDETGAHNPGPDTKSFGYPPTDLKASFLKVI